MTTALICSRCGSVAATAGAPCPSCGTEPGRTPEAPPPLPRCPACGAPPPPPDKLACPSCGLPLPPPVAVDDPPPVRPRRRLWLVPVLAVVGAIGGTLLTRTSDPGLVTAWRLHVGAAVVGAPVVDGATVLVATVTGDLVAVEAGTGRARWRFAADAPVTVGAAAAGGVAYVLAGETLYAVDVRTGDERWRAEGVDAAVAPVPVEGTVVVAGTDVVGYGTTDGAERFRVPGGDVTGLAGAGDMVVVAFGDGALGLVAASGSTAWEQGDPAAGVSLAGDAAVVLTGDGEAVGLALATGEERWRLPAVVASGAVLADGDDVLAVDPVTGRERWSAGGSPSLVAAGGVVATGDRDRVTVRQAADGERIGAVTVDDLDTLTVGGSVVYAASAEAIAAVVAPD